MQLDTYLFFNGGCAEALALYQHAFGAQIHTLIRFCDTPDGAHVAPEWQDKMMHALFTVGPNAVMASDGQFGQPKKDYTGFSLSIATDDANADARIFAALGEGGEVLTPWQSSYFMQGFGMLKDHFGVPWLVNVVHRLEEDAASISS